jgi:hypothetical protein
MADTKISALTGATTPLAGTEVLPIVQSGVTKKVSVADLTVGRSVQLADFVKITGSLTPVFVGASTSVGQLVVNRNPVTGVFDDTSKAACYINLHSEVGASYMGFYTTTANNTNPTLRWTLGSSGNLAPANGLGIDFSATPGTGTSELLNDYEEGDWTPVVSPSSGSITSYTATGKYTKVGRIVTLSFKITITTNGTGSGTLFVDGVPFSAAASASDGGAGRESANTGYGFVMTFGTTSRLYVNKADAGYPGANGDILPGTITYTAA